MTPAPETPPSYSKYVVPGELVDRLTDEGKFQVRKWWQECAEYDPVGEYDADTVSADMAKTLPWIGSVDVDDIADAVGSGANVVRDEDGHVTYFRARPIELGATFWDGGDYVRPVDWLFDGLVPRGSVGMIVGLPDALKTWIGMGMESSLLRGVPFAGFACRDGSELDRRRMAIHVDLEMGENELIRRARIVGAKGLGKMAYPPTMPNQPEFWVRMERLIRDSRDTLILIDSLSKTNEGIDEKTSGYADAISMSARFVAANETRTIAWIHHSPKDARSKGLMDLVRGHGAIAGGLDWCYHAERVGDANTKPDRARLTCKKMRRGATKPEPFVVQLTDARGIERWEESRGRGARAKGASEPARDARSDEDRVLDALRANADAGRSRDELCKLTGLSKSRAAAARQSLVAAGLVQDKGSYKSPHYVVVDSSERFEPAENSARRTSEEGLSDGSRAE